MRKFGATLLMLSTLWLASPPAAAVEPDEILADAALEERARNLSSRLRCMVCQNQSIDDSDAELARDLRVLVRERISAGDTDRQVLSYLVERYGEFVLLKPALSLRNALLWATPFAVLGIGGIALLLLSRRRWSTADEAPLSKEESARLAEILRDRR